MWTFRPAMFAMKFDTSFFYSWTRSDIKWYIHKVYVILEFAHIVSLSQKCIWLCAQMLSCDYSSNTTAHSGATGLSFFLFLLSVFLWNNIKWIYRLIFLLVNRFLKIKKIIMNKYLSYSLGIGNSSHILHFRKLGKY